MAPSMTPPAYRLRWNASSGNWRSGYVSPYPIQPMCSLCQERVTAAPGPRGTRASASRTCRPAICSAACAVRNAPAGFVCSGGSGTPGLVSSACAAEAAHATTSVASAVCHFSALWPACISEPSGSGRPPWAASATTSGRQRRRPAHGCARLSTCRFPASTACRSSVRFAASSHAGGLRRTKKRRFLCISRVMQTDHPKIPWPEERGAALTGLRVTSGGCPARSASHPVGRPKARSRRLP